MKQDLSLWQFGGFTFTSLGGTLLHFLFDWTGESILLAPFSGVNESTWEHMKLLFFPIFIWSIIQYRFFKNYQNFWCVKLYGILTGLITIPILFYTLNGVFGKTPDWLNIGIFFFSAAGVFILETKLFKSKKLSSKHSKFAIILICTIGALFILFTFLTPQIPLFKDPLTNKYGLK